MKYNCIFGGGGVRGMCYIGALKALKELKIKLNLRQMLRKVDLDDEEDRR